MVATRSNPHMRDRVELNPEEGIAVTRRKIGTSGNSVVVRIPPTLLESAHLEVDDTVEIVADMDEGGLTISKVEDVNEEPEGE